VALVLSDIVKRRSIRAPGVTWESQLARYLQAFAAMKIAVDALVGEAWPPRRRFDLMKQAGLSNQCSAAAQNLRWTQMFNSSLPRTIAEMDGHW
jgi:hypothetical protein